MLSAVVGDSASFSATARGETMTRAEATAAFNRAFDARFASGETWQAGAKQ